MFLNGTADPGDPPASVVGATATVPNALLVPVPGIGHWTLNWNPHPGCLLAATTAFFKVGQPARPAPWHACTRAPGRMDDLHGRRVRSCLRRSKMRRSRPSLGPRLVRNFGDH